ncbi:unnamed protein product [Brassica napus]|uniref:(rape) hypothetical protein n=1 Tax=Brassica napus TaxID=3708 RepID=A0A816KXW7_BRANA|nr:unnamed protein product [Brassica napus]
MCAMRQCSCCWCSPVCNIVYYTILFLFVCVFIRINIFILRNAYFLSYRIEMDIADDTAEGFFVCFDDVMTKLHNLKASQAGQMLGEKGVNPEDSRMPLFITYM